MKAELNWVEGMEFNSKGDSGHNIVIDASEENKGPNPMELVLNGVAGCTAIDIVVILDRMRLELEDLNIKVEGKRAEEPPKKFTEINLDYKLKGKDLTEHKVERAIKLSIEKYCSASNSLDAEINYTYTIED